MSEKNKGTLGVGRAARHALFVVLSAAGLCLALAPQALANVDDIYLETSGSFAGSATGSGGTRTYTTPISVNYPSPLYSNGLLAVTVAIHDKRWSITNSGVTWGSTVLGTSAVKARSCGVCSDPAPATEIWGAPIGSATPSGTISITLTGPSALADPEISFAYYFFTNVAQSVSIWGNDGGGESSATNDTSLSTAAVARSVGLAVGAVDLTGGAATATLTSPAGTGETSELNGTNGLLLAFASVMPRIGLSVNSEYTISRNVPWAGSIISIKPFTTPTAVRFGSFRATTGSDGTRLRWRTGAEVSNLGFNVYREQAGVQTQVNRSLIAGSAFLVGPRTELSQGRGYEWVDPSPVDTSVRYFLEAIDVNGEKAVLGPVFAEPRHQALNQEDGFVPAAALDSIGRAAVEETAQPGIPAALGFEQGEDQVAAGSPSRNLSGPTATPPVPASSTQWDLAAGAAAKIGITQAGWYSVSRSALVAAGFDPGSDLGRLQLFADGVEIPILVRTTGSGKSLALASIEFYGTPIDTPYSGKHVYWLVRGSSSGQRVGPADQKKASGSLPSSFAFTVERKDRTVYFAALVNNGDASNFFGPIVNSSQLDQTLTLAHLDTSSAASWPLVVVLQGVTYPAQHAVDVLVNGQKVGTASFKDQALSTTTFQVPAKTLHEGQNTVSLVARGGSTDVSLVDTIRLTYPHVYVADTGALMLTAAGSAPLVVTGFGDGSVRIVDVTDPLDVNELAVTVASAPGGFKASAVVPEKGKSTRTLLAFTTSRVLSPASITSNAPSTLHSDKGKIDLVIVSNGAFLAASNTLKAWRQSQGLAVKVVDVEDIYDEYNFGHKSPYAVRTYLDTLTPGAGYVLLVGDATIDPRNYLGFGDYDLVPTKLVATSLLKTASDDWLVDFKADGLPDVAVGRLSVRTPAEAAAVVAKLKAFDQNLASKDAWHKKVLQVADQDDPPNVNSFSFEKAVGSLALLLPSDLTVQNVLAGQDGARTALLSGLNAGSLLVTFVGHGTQDSWSKLHVFDQVDAAALTNGTKLPVVVTMDCLNGLFIDAYSDSLAEVLQKAPNGGAAAVWASSALTNPEPQGLMATALYKSLFGKASVRLGDATNKAKAAAKDWDAQRTWILFGDPTMKLR